MACAIVPAIRTPGLNSKLRVPPRIDNGPESAILCIRSLFKVPVNEGTGLFSPTYMFNIDTTSVNELDGQLNWYLICVQGVSNGLLPHPRNGSQQAFIYNFIHTLLDFPKCLHPIIVHCIGELGIFRKIYAAMAGSEDRYSPCPRTPEVGCVLLRRSRESRYGIG